MTDHGLDRSLNAVRNANDSSRTTAVGVSGAPGHSGGAAETLERAAWIVLLPFYLVLAVAVTVVYAIAVVVVHVRS